MSQQLKLPETPWPPGTEVVAVYSFKGGTSEDLPFSRKDVLSIVNNTKDTMWYIAKNKNGQEGMIPVNYVQKRGEVKLNIMPWFHGKIGRLEAENLLKPKEDGLFLVRESTNYPGDYTLCVCFGQKVEHYHIIYKNEKLTIDEEEYFENLIELVEHYEDDADGLCTRLIKPLEKSGDMAISVTRRDFIDQGWQVRRKDVELGEKLGKGEFGEVYKARYNGQEVAVKTLKDNSSAKTRFLQEASVMTSLRHRNLVQLIGVVLGDTIYIITEFCSKGSLVEYLRSRGRSVITPKDQINFACDTCCGMAYLESKKVVHRDLAARNVLISVDYTAKVSDFGLAKQQGTAQSGGLFPIKWTAPEALRDNKFTSKSDMWSFGILLWEIYSYGRVPYPRIPLADVMVHLVRGYRMDCPDNCRAEVFDIMQSAWQFDADRRPTFHEILDKLETIRSATL